MTALVLQLVVMLLLILVAAEVFTNALEHLGERLGISEGVTGSLFAAVGTALPETIVPLLAIFGGTASAKVNQEVGIGAILGAPLMLSTLSICLMAVFVIKKRGLTGRITPEASGFRHDMTFFLFVFAVAIAAMFIPPSLQWLRLCVSGLLVLSYFVYVTLMIRASNQLVEAGHGTEAESPMYCSRIGLPTNSITIAMQLLLGLAMLVGGAKGFIYGVEGVSHALGISALLLSLLIIPIATELPEKVNSILWVRKGKDTLAVGNITGAMVFQGSLLPAMGIALTAWEPRAEVLVGMVITLIAAVWLRANARKEGMPVWALLVNGALYLTYLSVMLFS